MKCQNCGDSFSANWLSPAPGGYSAPGTFFIFNVGVLSVFLAIIFCGYLIATIPVGFILLIGLSANLTSWLDSNCHMGSKGEHIKGLPCPKCKHIHPVYPWTL